MTSKIKVDNIENQCGGAVVTKCGGTTTISGSVVKANNIQASDAGNIISQCGTAITIGASGDTVSLASGASQSGFGRSGSVDWQTTAKTGDFTAANGEGYFVNTTSGEITATLPSSPSVGDIVAFKDFANTFDTNKLTINRNGSNIGGDATNAEVSVEGQSLVLVYSGSAEGWLVTAAATDADLPRPAFITATGGTITTSGNYKIHSFTGPGTFCVSAIGNPAAVNEVSYLVVAGGGSGGQGSSYGGGGGAGGFRESKAGPDCYTASPLEGSTNVSVTATAFPITVGAGGTGFSGPTPRRSGNCGSASVFSTVTSAGGGGGGAYNTNNGSNGGSGGGSGDNSTPISDGGSGNTPPVSPPQGNPGGGMQPAVGAAVGGGGGATAAGSPGNPSGPSNGGAGATTSITASPVAYAGGGGGGGNPPIPNAGGSGGGGAGGHDSPDVNGTAGTANTGGGGGGNGPTATDSGNGGSGIVIIRYKFQ
jgi:hypothetical protein